ncbi:MAG: 16S rRNA (adenine(1518)-N(6)/adenine(1519)-N(6))-dimethyltransferase RsmA [bacterium]|jgi:16S rRNA (adenine1518-N6/adenine1519-N6)-dimethyltransferase
MPSTLYAKKKWGQHFLVRESVVERIAQTSGVQAGDVVWEIGPGEGALTEKLLKAGCTVIATEVDPRACEWLTRRFTGVPEFILHAGDVMEWSEEQVSERIPQDSLLVANLPYNIATPLMVRLFANRQRWTSLTLMVQQEVAERFCATSKDGKAYGPLSLLGGLGFEARIAFSVLPEAFRPPPKVRSAVLHLIPRNSGMSPAQEQDFLGWSRRLFQARRKTLWNNVQSAFPQWTRDERLRERLGQLRPENLDLPQWLELFQEFQCFQESNCSP